MFEDFRRERFIRKTLRRLARQRVRLVVPLGHPPTNVWVAEHAVQEETDDGIAAAIRTCHMRGWVELLHDAVPRAQLGPDGRPPQGWQGTSPCIALPILDGTSSEARRLGYWRRSPSACFPCLWVSFRLTRPDRNSTRLNSS